MIHNYLLWQVANLFARDEMDEIMGELIPVMKKEFPRRPPSNENLYEYYLTRVRNNLHVVLCFSPVSYPETEIQIKTPFTLENNTVYRKLYTPCFIFSPFTPIMKW